MQDMCSDAYINQASNFAFPHLKQDVCKWEFKASTLGTTVSSTSTQTMSGKGILDLRNSLWICSTTATTKSARTNSHASLHHFNTIKCLHVLLNRLEKAYSTPLHPIEISVGLGIFILIEAFTLSIFIQIGLIKLTVIGT